MLQFATPARVYMEPRSLEGLTDVVRAQGGSKALVITDKGIRGAGLLDHVIAPLEQARVPIEVFDRELAAAPPGGPQAPAKRPAKAGNVTRFSGGIRFG